MKKTAPYKLYAVIAILTLLCLVLLFLLLAPLGDFTSGREMARQLEIHSEYDWLANAYTPLGEGYTLWTPGQKAAVINAIEDLKLSGHISYSETPTEQHEALDCQILDGAGQPMLYLKLFNGDGELYLLLTSPNGSANTYFYRILGSTHDFSEVVANIDYWADK